MADQSDQRPLVLLDGMSLAFRAFFALSTDIATSSGLVTNALHGFASMLHSLVRSQTPRALAVAFDLPGGTFRDEMTPDYKGGRAATPPEIEHQFELIRSFCEVLHIPVLGVTHFEADDVLATLATWGRDAEIPVVVVTGDRDCFQLVEDPFVRVLYNRRGVSDYSLYDEAGIFERCGVEPSRYPILAAMRGDVSDNLPGVPGVGEKTAAKLLSSYRDFDEIYEHLDELTPKLRENLTNFEERARQNERVMRLIRDVPLDFTLQSLTLGGWDRSAVGAFFERFEMNSMRTRFEKLMNDGLLGESATSTGSDAALVSPSPIAAQVYTRATTLNDAISASRALTVLLQGSRVGVLDEVRAVAAVGSLDEFLGMVGDRPLAGHDIKEIFRAGFERNVTLAEPDDDTAIMAFLIDATSGRYDLTDVAQRFLGEVLGSATPSLFEENADDEALFAQLGVVARLRTVLRKEIDRWELDHVYRTIELPLVAVLGRMEARGVRVDVEMLRTIASEFTQEAQRLDAQIQQVAGHDFKVNSPQQLQTVLFSELGLTTGKKIKTGFSTDASTLEAISDEHRIVPLILRYREVEKLRSTYGAPLIDAVAPDGRIHALFHQTVARTGRLSSENPNLHNIPVRSAEGRRLRYAFVPTTGWTLAVADYNQIELRILAHLSQDSGLLSAFASHEDVHRTIAGSVFSIAPTEVSHEQREQAKAVSYGLAYGMEAFGLSQRLGVPVSAAKEIMEKYFAGFPTLRRYMDDTIKLVRSQGFSRTEFGRIRPFADLATAVGPQRAAAERQAMNAGIQGLAADIFKSALVRLDHRLSDENLSARLILQVHDEVLVEAPVDETSQVEVAIIEALTQVAELSVPLEISLHWGDSWAAAKG
ncbi:MAG: DNA polymerase I [Acidimicrobiaceae bacterium]|nr:DNA polymerase I [Acidimicrobiaceae bacterium]